MSSHLDVPSQEPGKRAFDKAPFRPPTEPTRALAPEGPAAHPPGFVPGVPRVLADDGPEAITAQSLVAVAAGFLPLLITLYAILNAGSRLQTTFKLTLTVGVAGLYGAALWGIGALLCRRAERAIAGRTLLISAGVIAALVSTVTWFAPTSGLGLLSTGGAVGLMALAAGLHARVTGRSSQASSQSSSQSSSHAWPSTWYASWPLLLALALLGMSGRLVLFVGRPSAVVLDVIAATLAGAVFLRPDRRQEPAGRIVLALAVPAATLLLKPFWWLTVAELSAVAVCLLFVLRAVRAHLHAGTTTLCAIGLLGGHLLIAVDTAPSRLLGLVAAVAALLLLVRDVEGDSDAATLDRRAPAWLAGIAWVTLAATWAHDSGIGQAFGWFGHASGLGTSALPVVALLALPFALPPLLLSQWRRKTAPLELDLEELPPGAVAEIAGWAVLAVAQVVALWAAPTAAPLAFIVLAIAAAVGMVWSRLLPHPRRFVAAHALLLAAAWGFAQAPAAPLLGALAVVGPSIVLLAAATALLLALAPWFGGQRATGMFGFVAFPLLTAEALYRDAPPQTAAAMLGIFGLAQLIRPPLAEFPATRLVGPAALVSAAWLILSSASHAVGEGDFIHITWLNANPLSLLAGLASVLAMPLLAVAHRQRRLAGVDAAPAPGPDYEPLPIELDPGFVYEAMAWALLALALALSLSPLPALPWTSAGALVTGAAIAAGWAQRVSTPWRRGGAHVLLVAACWAVGHRVGGPVALLAGSVCACLLAIAPARSGRPSEQARWVGLVCIPFAIADAIASGAPVLAAGILLIALGVAYVARPPLASHPWTQGVGPAALLAAAWLLLFENGSAPVLPASSLGTAAALALMPFALWVAFVGVPVIFLVQVVIGSLVIALLDCSAMALLPLFILTLGRGPLVVACGAPALLAGAVVVAAYGPGSGVTAGAAAFAIGGASLLFRTLPPETDRLRLLGFPGLVMAPIVLAFVPHGAPHDAGTSLLAVEHLPLVAALAVAPFGLWLWRRPHPAFLVSQTLATAAFVALLAIGAAFVSVPGTWSAAEAGVAGLLALAAVVAAAQGVGPELRPIAWGFAALGALLALAPTSSDPWHWPVTIVGAIDVIILGRAARRRESPVLATFALWLTLLVLAWMGAAFTERLIGGDLLTLVPSLGISAALAGLLVLWRGTRWLGAPSFFLRPFIQTCLILSAIAATMSLTIVPVQRTADVVQALSCAAAVAALALPVAFAERASWPLFLAGGAAILPYAYLRARTQWLALDSGWDAVVAVGAGALISWGERPWRRALNAPPPPDMAEDPAQMPFAVAELRLIAAMVTGLSAVAFLDLHGVRAALGPALASVYFLWRTRREEDNGPVYGVLAAIFCNTTIVLLLLDRQVVSTGAYTLPIFFSVALLMHVYREHLGHEEATVRTIPAAIALLLCSYETINTPSLAPTAALGALGAGLLFGARLFRLRTYLLVGLLALLLAGLDTAVGLRFASSGTSGNALRFLPIASCLFAVVGALLIAVGARVFQAPAELLRPFVQACISLAAVAAGIAMVVGPANTFVDVTLTLVAAAAVLGLSLYVAFAGDRAAWAILLAGGALVAPYVFLRMRTPWLASLAPWDGLVAVAMGLAISALEPALRRASGAPPRPVVLPEPLNEVPFGVVELRLVTGFVVSLAAVAFFHLREPIDAIGPALATLFFLWRTRSGNPVYSVLAAAFINVTFVMFLIERNVSSPTAYSMPFFASVGVLLHLHREHLSDQDSTIRVLPPIAAAAVGAYEAMVAKGQLLPAVALAGLGVILLVLSRVWRLRSHSPIGLACIAAALLTTITEWNARGWTTAAIALGAATLLVPAFLLRSR